MQSFIIVEYCFIFELKFILGCKFNVFEVSFFLGEKIYIVYKIYCVLLCLKYVILISFELFLEIVVVLGF